MEDKNYVNNLIPLILDEISEAIFVIEGNQTITYQNKVALDLFGESIGGNVFDLLIFEKSTILVDAIFENKSVEMEAKIFLTKKGGWHDFIVRYLPEGRFIILKDVTFLKNIEETKLNLSVLLAHELKNPLSVLQSLLADLIENEEDEGKLGRLWKMERQIKRIGRIIQQIEYITMAQLGLYTPRKETLQAKKILDEVLEEVENIREQKKITIKTYVETKTIEGDSFIIKTILKNLISNAIKYSFDNSEVTIKIGADRLEVRDNGIGVPDSEKEKIFTRFYRTQSAVKMSSGSGLGLSVIKHLSNLAGYRITFESQYLIGTTVIIWLE